MNRRTKLEHRIVYAVIGLLFAVTVIIGGALVYYTQQQNKLANAPVDVLTNWTLKVDSSHPYQPGDLIPVSSKVTKLINVSGQSNRFIQCYKPNTKEWDALIPVNVTKATNPASQNRSGGFTIGIPLSIGVLPNTCRIYVSVTYDVNKYHPAFQESNYTNAFSIIPRPGLVSESPNETIIYPGTPTNNSSKSSEVTVPDQTPIVIYRNDTPASDSENSPASNQQPNQNIIQRILGRIL